MKPIVESTSEVSLVTKQTAIRLTDENLHLVQVACRVEGISMNTLVNNSIAMYIEERRKDPKFKARARELLDTEVKNFKKIL